MYHEKVIQGKSVSLRSVTLEDAAYTYEIRQNKEKTKYIHPVTGTVEDQEQWIKEQIKRVDDYFFIVIDEKKKKPIGTIGVYNINKDKQTCWAGRTLLYGTPIQSTETNYLIFEFIFNELKCLSVYADVNEVNTAAIGLNLQFGAKKIGRKYYKELDSNMILFKIDKEKYFKKRSKILKLIERFAKR